MTWTLSCRCGQVTAQVEEASTYTRATCYCRDCQAYARFLGEPHLLDAWGGTDIIAMAPAGMRIVSGHARLACVSLGAKGLLRWYAACCRTPLGNTPRDGGMAYVGIIATYLSPAGVVNERLGQAGRIVLNGGSATAPVRATPLALVLGGLRIFANVLAAKLRRQPPALFFDADGQPIRDPQVLSPGQRAALDA